MEMLVMAVAEAAVIWLKGHLMFRLVRVYQLPSVHPGKQGEHLLLVPICQPTGRQGLMAVPEAVEETPSMLLFLPVPADTEEAEEALRDIMAVTVVPTAAEVAATDDLVQHLIPAAVHGLIVLPPELAVHTEVTAETPEIIQTETALQMDRLEVRGQIRKIYFWILPAPEMVELAERREHLERHMPVQTSAEAAEEAAAVTVVTAVKEETATHPVLGIMVIVMPVAAAEVAATAVMVATAATAAQPHTAAEEAAAVTAVTAAMEALDMAAVAVATAKVVTEETAAAAMAALQPEAAVPGETAVLAFALSNTIRKRGAP